ncbi:hypothetical protein ACIA5D_36710 [Actinoplanes sp. NPDC051513]|uniref:hypothetical protein n=1 Tax=Actinoplanes sp. NPDC051513 TaxID=3363908 RepID=UPI0037980230
MASLTRVWFGTGRRSVCRVEVNGLWRGTIRTTGIEDTLRPGIAGHLVYQAVTYDGVWLDPVASDYVQAERALLNATKELDD